MGAVNATNYQPRTRHAAFGQRDLLKAGAALLATPLLAGVSTDIQARTSNEKKEPQ